MEIFKKLKKNSFDILHYPRLNSILMVEKAILESKDYLTRMELWRVFLKKCNIRHLNSY